MPDHPLAPLAAAVLHVPAPERALVIGCGDGEAVLFLAREFPAARVRGVDSSETLVRKAGARVGLDPEGRVAFKLGKPRTLPYPDDHFDLVVQQLGDRSSAAETVRVLRPGAYLILAGSPSLHPIAGVREALHRRHLTRLGIEPVPIDSAAGGNFFVGRLSLDG
jgi:SAM-dependent methyltransferase